MQQQLHAVSSAMPWFFPVFVFVVGACIGSFLNVCILRIPLGESIVRPRSHCRTCGAPIAWYDNIPILSWLILRGRARCCGASFSFRYPFIELLTATLFLACWLLFAPVSPAKAVCGMIFVSALVCATFTDIDHFQIPDVFTVGLAAVGLTLSFLVPSLHGQTAALLPAAMLRSGFEAILGLCVGSAILYWLGVFFSTLLRKPAMGEQDVLLLGAIGTFCGWQGALFSIFGGAIIGVVALAPVAFFGKISRKKIAFKTLDADQPPAELSLKSDIPYGPMLAAGALLYFLYLHRWVDAYLDNVARLIWS